MNASIRRSGLAIRLCGGVPSLTGKKQGNDLHRCIAVAERGHSASLRFPSPLIKPVVRTVATGPAATSGTTAAESIASSVARGLDGE